VVPALRPVGRRFLDAEILSPKGRDDTELLGALRTDQVNPLLVVLEDAGALVLRFVEAFEDEVMIILVAVGEPPQGLQPFLFVG
jgi:hypothetical protein